MLGAVVAAAVLLLMPRTAGAEPREPSRVQRSRGCGGFWLLFAIGVLDTGVRMGLLTFLPFLLAGVLLTVLATEGGTAVCIFGVLVLPLFPCSCYFQCWA